MRLHDSVGPAGAAEGGHQIVWNSNKGADLLLNRPHWIEGDYGVIELIHAAFPFSGRMIFSIVSLLQLIKGKNVAGISKRFSVPSQMC